MTSLTRPASGQRPDTATLARLAALDLAQDDIVRPELRNDAILAGRRHQRYGRSRQPNHHPR